MTNIPAKNISSDSLFKVIVELEKQNNQKDKALQKMTEENYALRNSLEQTTRQLAQMARQLDQAASTNEKLVAQVSTLTEQINLFTQQLFGAHSEKAEKKKTENKKSKTSTGKKDSDDSDQTPPGANISSVKTVKPRRKPKQKKEKKPLLEILADMGIVPETVSYDVPEDQRFCSACHTPLELIGDKHLFYTIEFLPAQLVIKDHRLKSYCCPKCKQKAASKKADFSSLSLKPVTAEPKQTLLPGAWVTPSLFAFLVWMKAEHQVPLKRSIDMLVQQGNYAPVYSTVCDWIIRVTLNIFFPLFRG